MAILSFENEFVRQNKGRGQLIRFMREAIGKKEVEWGDLSTLKLSKVCDYITDRCSSNSACTYFAIIKAFLAKYKDEELIPCKHPEKVLKARKEPSQNVYLTEEEIDRIEHYLPYTDCERDVKHAFLIECYLGARRSDVLQITSKNIVGNRIVYVSQKTKTEVSVPIHRNLMKHLKYNPKKERGTACFNRVIQRICQECGIDSKIRIYYHGKMQERKKYEFVGSHTARRSFCTNLAKRGVDIYTIAALAGHGQNIQMTQRYIVTDVETLTDKTMAFFNS